MIMGKKYLGAMTGLEGTMPQFINFSQDGDNVVLTARSTVAEGSREIATSFPSVLFGLMLEQMNTNFAKVAKEPVESESERFRPPYPKKKPK